MDIVDAFTDVDCVVVEHFYALEDFVHALFY